MIEAHLTGLFPRSEELIQATRAAVRGKVAQTEVEAALRRDLASLIGLQTENGLDYVVDGQLNWQDLFRPFSSLFTGIEVGGLVRWFDNNAFYRKPIIIGKIRYSKDGVSEYFRASMLSPSVRKKAILPGPFTFAVMSQNGAYASLSDLVDDVAHALREVLVELHRLGYEYFQLDEPSLCAKGRTAEELKLAKQGIETIAKGTGMKTTLQTYFGDSSVVIDALLDYPVDCIGLDFYSTSLEGLRGRSFGKEIACGCVDGRNSLLESADELGSFMRKVREYLEPTGMSVCTNSDLQFLPYSIAQEKVRLLSAVKRNMEV
jgi:5-methyltetrahydropteroyltriglutamate--homocysteine methyltransferase